jgi:hypothetical protein
MQNVSEPTVNVTSSSVQPSCLGYTPRTSGGEVAARERGERFKTEFLKRWDASHW